MLRDLRATCDVALDVRDGWTDAPGPAAMVWDPSGSGSGVFVVDGADPLAQLVAVTDRMRDIAIEALWSARHSVTWPECPEHPRSHPLEVNADGHRAVWRCPRSGTVVAEVGTLRR